jgi:shikimate kinase
MAAAPPAGTPAGECHLVLVGLMGVGKTTVGERCAAALDRPFVDTDDLVEATAHLSVPEIFDTLGEPAFRALERTAVADASASPSPLVIACGGGAVLDAESRTRLRSTGVVLWLQAPPAVLNDRVARAGEAADTSGARERPLLRSGAVSTLERLALVRAPAYEAAAHAVIDTTGRTVDEVAAAALEVFRALDVERG